MEYHGRINQGEFRILEQEVVEFCAEDASERLSKHIKDNKIDPEATYFDLTLDGTPGGQFPCVDHFSQNILIRFSGNVERYKRASMAMALRVLGGMKEAAKIGYVETAFIIVYKINEDLTSEGHGLVDLMALLDPKPKVETA